MAVTAPDWLTLHGCKLQASKDGCSWTVYMDGQPQYTLVPEPAGGKHSCRVMQTNNGKRLDTSPTFATVEDAARGGLEELRKALGW